MIKGVVFDLDGVFFLNGTENFIKNVSKKFSIPEEKIIQSYKKSDGMNKYYKTGKWNGNHYWSWFIKELGINSTKEELLDILSEGYEINQQALNLSRELRKKSYKILICSNNFPERIELLNNKFDFLKEFDFAVFSFEI
jgi:FMN phosphatase YigB (HAD superfamily)